MMGVVGSDPNGPDLKGIIPKSIRHIFGVIDGESGSKKFLVRCSYLEIYNERVIDLLTKYGDQKAAKGKNYDPENLVIKEDPDRGIFV
jgi:hypothetical protein